MSKKINNYCPIFDSYYDQFGQWTEKKCNSMHHHMYYHCPFCETRPEKHQHECRCIANIPYEEILKEMDGFPVSKALMKRLRKHYKNYEGLRDFIEMWNEEDFIEDRLLILKDIEESLDDIEHPKSTDDSINHLEIDGHIEKCDSVWIIQFDDIDIMVEGHSKKDAIHKAEDLIVVLVHTYFPEYTPDDFTVEIVNADESTDMKIITSNPLLLTTFWLTKKNEENNKNQNELKEYQYIQDMKNKIMLQMIENNSDSICKILKTNLKERGYNIPR